MRASSSAVTRFSATWAPFFRATPPLLAPMLAAAPCRGTRERRSSCPMMRFGHVELFVEDAKRAARFYIDVLGFELPTPVAPLPGGSFAQPRAAASRPTIGHAAS